MENLGAKDNDGDADNDDSNDNSPAVSALSDTSSTQTRARINISSGPRHPNRYHNGPTFQRKEMRHQDARYLAQVYTPYMTELGSEPMDLQSQEKHC